MEANKIEESLQCPICFELPEKEVYQCKNGHTVCDVCLESLEICPHCRVPYGEEKIRNRAVEAILEGLKTVLQTKSPDGRKPLDHSEEESVQESLSSLVPTSSTSAPSAPPLAAIGPTDSTCIPCPFRSEGCHALVRRSKLQQHEQSCSFRPWATNQSTDQQMPTNMSSSYAKEPRKTPPPPPPKPLPRTKKNRNHLMIASLKNDGILTSPILEEAMRLVDRSNYVVQKSEDLKQAGLQYTAYATILQSFDLQSGHMFLTIGSGTGNVSTLAGFFLGRNGFNHGIEENFEIVSLAEQKVKEFESKISSSMDICFPVFSIANLYTEDLGTYDRIFCTKEYHGADLLQLKTLLKVGGLCIILSGEEFIEIWRISETNSVSSSFRSTKLTQLVIKNDF